MSLGDLPVEVVYNIAEHFDKRTLKNTRLLNRSWNGTLIHVLFQTISLAPTRRSLRAWHGITEEQYLRQIPKEIVINYLPVDNRRYRTEADGFNAAFDGITMLTSIESVVIRFVEPEEEDELVFHDVKIGAEMRDYRHETMQRFFGSLANRTRETKFSTIKSFTVVGLQNMPIRNGLHPTDLFLKNILTTVHQLSLLVGDEVNNTHPQTRVDLLAGVELMPRVMTAWLVPVAARLRTLDLYCAEFWGPVDKCFQIDLHCPMLEHLALGKYCFAYRSAADWILRQKSLRSLRLHHCVIVSYIYVDTSDLDGLSLDTHDWNKVPDDLDENLEVDVQVYHYPGSWAEIFDRIQDELTDLMTIQISFAEDLYRSAGQEMQDFQNGISSHATQISPWRYVIGDIDLRDSLWMIDAEDTPDLSAENAALGENSNIGERNSIVDHTALNNLLGVLKDRQMCQRRKPC